VPCDEKTDRFGLRRILQAIEMTRRLALGEFLSDFTPDGLFADHSSSLQGKGKKRATSARKMSTQMPPIDYWQAPRT
jgi:hypothetical protein